MEEFVVLEVILDELMYMFYYEMSMNIVFVWMYFVNVLRRYRKLVVEELIGIMDRNRNGNGMVDNLNGDYVC